MLTPQRNGRRRRRTDDHQLTLPVAWLSEAAFVEELHERGATSIHQVKFKPNRTRMISLSGDRRTLNVHECFRAATRDVLDAVATFVRLSSRTSDYRRAVQRMRAWWDGQVHAEDFAGAPARSCCGTPAQRAFLERTYDRLNQVRFGGALPERVPLRLSNRMSRRFGHVHYATTRDGRRVVEEIALNVDLMIEGNEKHLLDTLLHEMAHIEAWLQHGHRDHGAVWREIARRIACEAKACSVVRIRRRRGARAPITHVPRLLLPAAPLPVSWSGADSARSDAAASEPLRPARGRAAARGARRR